MRDVSEEEIQSNQKTLSDGLSRGSAHQYEYLPEEPEQKKTTTQKQQVEQTVQTGQAEQTSQTQQ